MMQCFRGALVGLLLTTAACTATDTPDPNTDTSLIPVTIGVSQQTNPESRTQLDPDGITVRWAEGDRIALWAADPDGGYLCEAAEFALSRFSTSWQSAWFRGDIPQPTAREYTYMAVCPVPASTSGTRATYEIPDVQDGTFDGSCDVMVATPTLGPALTQQDDNTVNLPFTHKIHLLKIRLRNNRLGEAITSMELTFPQPVTGRLTVDAAEAQAAPEFDGQGTVLTLRFPEPLEVTPENEPVVYATIAPVDIPADEQIAIKLYGSTEQSLPATMSGKLFAEGHTTPIVLNIPDPDIANTTLRLRLENTGEQTLGERIHSFTLSTDAAGVLFDNGAQSRTFTVNGAGDYDMIFPEYPEALQGQPVTVTYESENAVLSRTISLPATINKGKINPVETPLSVPYLLEEAFDNVAGFDYNAGNSTSATSSGSNNAKQLSEYGMAEGWSGVRCSAEAGKAIRICCRNEYGGWGLASVHGTYHGRVDSPALSGIRDGKSPNIRITFNYSFNRECNTGSTNPPYLAFGISNDTDRNAAGTSSPGSEYYTHFISKAVLYDLTGALTGTFDYIPFGGESSPVIIQSVDNTYRLVWEVYMKDKEVGTGGSFGINNTMSNNWGYIDNIKVSIAN